MHHGRAVDGPGVDSSIVEDHLEGREGSWADVQDLEEAGLAEADRDVEKGVVSQFVLGSHFNIKLISKIKITSISLNLLSSKN